ncbi:hypothetical protein FE634_03825 [Nocardioides dongxiaopingii]|uniref:hypothetical protein n=1 Tax=Nocardioides TaxID=1839 RepID=UPI0010C765F5|nr:MULTISPECIES: hypothetical protein [Nocardioides]QCW49754.1 hypothetical protein FE634_03825 [Nocardioides sp. S-1144]
MRCSRLVTVLLALVLAALLPTAAPAGATTAGGPAAARVAAADDPITITSKVVSRDGRRKKGLFLVGKVTPSEGPVYIQRATRCSRETNSCNFRLYRKKYLKQGRYEAKIAAPPTRRGWMWRARVGTSYSDAWVTCTKTPRQAEAGKDCKIPF